MDPHLVIVIISYHIIKHNELILVIVNCNNPRPWIKSWKLIYNKFPLLAMLTNVRILSRTPSPPPALLTQLHGSRHYHWLYLFRGAPSKISWHLLSQSSIALSIQTAGNLWTLTMIYITTGVYNRKSIFTLVVNSLLYRVNINKFNKCFF